MSKQHRALERKLVASLRQRARGYGERGRCPTLGDRVVLPGHETEPWYIQRFVFGEPAGFDIAHFDGHRKFLELRRWRALAWDYALWCWAPPPKRGIKPT